VIRRKRFGEQCVKQTSAGRVSGGQTGLQPIAQCHQLIDLGNDALLFGEGREGKSDFFQIRSANSPVADSCGAYGFDLCSNKVRIARKPQELWCSKFG
jgi:hypothetical protein